MSDIQIFNNKELKLKVRTIQNENGSISIKAEDTAKGFGWVQTKNNKDYVRWETINGFIEELGFSQQVGKDDYVPESLFYLLAMKANNKVAQDFQKWLATEVIPSIRKTGSYEIPKMSKELQAIFMLDGKTEKIDQRITKIENTMTIETGKQKVLCDLVNKKVTAILGGKDTPAYKELNKKAFTLCWKDYKRNLDVASYKDTALKDFDLAKKTIIDWKPNRELELMIKGCNSVI
jgi:anti-repressor protein